MKPVILSIFALALGCSSKETLVQRRAAEDFHCPEAQVVVTELPSLDGFTVRGCTKSELYVVNRVWGIQRAFACPSPFDAVWESETKPGGVHRGQCARLRGKAGMASMDPEWWWDDDYACPVGTKIRGGGPPVATELWCEGPFGKNGPYTAWWASGTKKTEGHYFDGISGVGCSEGKKGKEIKHGKWRYWDVNGDLLKIEKYTDGKIYETVDSENGRTITS